MIIDTHAHLMFEQFNDDFDAVLTNAKEAGVSKIVNIGCDEKSSKQAVLTTEKDLDLFAAVGMHPYEAADCTEKLMKEWEQLIHENQKVIAVGETGLDYVKSKASKNVQQKAFRMQLQLARMVDLPVIVHNREADEDCLQILGEFSEVKAVFHCYASDLAFARKVWNAGHLTSFTGIITYKGNDALREVVAACPMNMFMVETDCPFLAPQKYRGQRNEPAYVVETLKIIAEVKGIDFEKVRESAYVNTLNFFYRIGNLGQIF
ncbi:TatD family hydrolase [Candidatus Peregrinibacteria bacterium]|nr:TatD family hydrolase [Candidatus Peregrinibacteria bacterium]